MSRIDAWNTRSACPCLKKDTASLTHHFIPLAGNGREKTRGGGGPWNIKSQQLSGREGRTCWVRKAYTLCPQSRKPREGKVVRRRWGRGRKNISALPPTRRGRLDPIGLEWGKKSRVTEPQKEGLESFRWEIKGRGKTSSFTRGR